MFGLFRKKASQPAKPTLTDLNNIPLKAGDQVRSLRYDLGNCILQIGEEGFYYKSLDSGKEVNSSLMYDAVTGRQKVEKIDK